MHLCCSHTHTCTHTHIYIFSLTIEILGQHPNRSPDINAGLQRVSAIVIGCAIAFLGSLIIPFSSTNEIKKLAKYLVRNASALLNWYMEQYVAFGERISKNSAQACLICLTPEVLATAPCSLERDINIPLDRLRWKVEKETLAWHCGPMSHHRSFARLVEALQLQTLHLAAVDEILHRSPVLLGMYGDPQRGSVPHHKIIFPLRSAIKELEIALLALDAAITDALQGIPASLMHGPGYETPAHTAIKHVLQARSELLVRFSELRDAMHSDARHEILSDVVPQDLNDGESIADRRDGRCDGVARAEEGVVERESTQLLRTHDLPVAPDDAVLYLSFFFAWLGGQLGQESMRLGRSEEA